MRQAAMEGMTYAYKVLVRKPGAKVTLGTARTEDMIILKWGLKK